eukprot:51241-Eustigmatos_ZCMA.PRE.1
MHSWLGHFVFRVSRMSWRMSGRRVVRSITLSQPCVADVHRPRTDRHAIFISHARRHTLYIDVHSHDKALAGMPGVCACA